MRRVIGLILAGLGAFLIAAGLLFRTYVGGHLLKFPLNEYAKTTLEARNATYFSPVLVREVKGATIEVTDTVKGDGAAGTSSTAVWNEFTYLYDLTNHKVFEFTTRRAAFDRRTSELVNCCGANIGGNTHIQQTGLSGYVWPFGAQKTTYYVFDTVLKKPMPYTYEGTGTIGGITVYKYVEQVTPTQAGTVTLPASLVGMKGSKEVTLPEFYTATYVDWVDPVTGAPLSVNEYQKIVLRDDTGKQRLVLLDADLTMTPQSQSKVVHTDAVGRSGINELEVTIPLVFGLIGLLALIAGIVLGRLRRDDEPEGADSTEPEPALDPAV